MSNSFRLSKTLKTLSIATLTGVAGFMTSNSASADVKAPVPTLGDNSAYTIGQGNESDYVDVDTLLETGSITTIPTTFKYITFDENNNLVTDYHKVELKGYDSYFENSGHLSYEEVGASGSNVIEINNILEDSSKYYKYTYNQPADYSVMNAKQEDSKLKKLETSIDDLDFSVRAYNCLKRAGVNTLGDLTSKSEVEMMKIRNLGKKSLKEVIDKIKDMGLRFREDD